MDVHEAPSARVRDEAPPLENCDITPRTAPDDVPHGIISDAKKANGYDREGKKTRF